MEFRSEHDNIWYPRVHVDYLTALRHYKIISTEITRPIAHSIPSLSKPRPHPPVYSSDISFRMAQETHHHSIHTSFEKRKH
jgi:hypothetical protein